MALTGLCCSIMIKVRCLGTFGARLVIEEVADGIDWSLLLNHDQSRVFRDIWSKIGN